MKMMKMIPVMAIHNWYIITEGSGHFKQVAELSLFNIKSWNHTAVYIVTDDISMVMLCQQNVHPNDPELRARLRVYPG